MLVFERKAPGRRSHDQSWQGAKGDPLQPRNLLASEGLPIRSGFRNSRVITRPGRFDIDLTPEERKLLGSSCWAVGALAVRRFAMTACPSIANAAVTSDDEQQSITIS